MGLPIGLLQSPCELVVVTFYFFVFSKDVDLINSVLFLVLIVYLVNFETQNFQVKFLLKILIYKHDNKKVKIH